MVFNVDFVSDLHIESWDTKLHFKHPYGERKNKKFNIKPSSEILIVAGDISDNIHLSIKYLNHLSKYYNYILFVDGNHEHVEIIPKLYSHKQINELFLKNNNPKLIYLPENTFIYENTAFVGYCGWWNFNNSDFLKKKDSKSYSSWINNSKENDGLVYNNNIQKRSILEFKKINQKINKLESNKKIKNICIVTHTLPLKRYGSTNYFAEHNTLMNNIKSKKLTHWFFGHTHSTFDEYINDIRYVCNPRGRPDDFNRENYYKWKINIK